MSEKNEQGVQIKVADFKLTEDGRVLIDDPAVFEALSELQDQQGADEEGVIDVTINGYRCGKTA